MSRTPETPPQAPPASWGSQTVVTTRLRERCPWCGSPEKTTVCDHAFDQEPLRSAVKDMIPPPGLRFRVHECRRCRTLYQEAVLREDVTSDYYESWPYEETPLEFTLFYVQELLMVLAHFDRPARDIRVLDYGMGWGRFCQVAATLGLDACGYDLNRYMREHGRSLGIRVIDLLDDLEPGSLDFINMEQVLEHVASPRELVATLSRLLKVGGILKISVPSRPPGIASRLRRIGAMSSAEVPSRLMEIFPLIHVNCFNPGALKTVLSETLPYRRIHLDSLFFVGRRGLLARVLGRPIYKNYAPGANYLFFEKR